MISHDERCVLEFLQLNQTTCECYKPEGLVDCFIGEEKSIEDIANICTTLSNKKLITLRHSSSGNRKLSSCYSISDKGIDELNPSSRNKDLYKFALLGTIFAGIAAIASIISIFT